MLRTRLTEELGNRSGGPTFPTNEDGALRWRGRAGNMTSSPTGSHATHSTSNIKRYRRGGQERGGGLGLGIHSFQKNGTIFVFFIKERNDLCVLYKRTEQSLRSL